jgi:branched-chain amino acid transport system permease protein
LLSKSKPGPNLNLLALILGPALLAQGLAQALPPSLSYFVSLLILAGINAVLAVSLNLVNGITGQFSLGHAGFMAVGAYTAAALDVFVFKSFLPAPLCFLFSALGAGLAAALAGYLVGLPSLRLRGDYLAIVTLGFGEIIRVSLLNMDSLGGARGFINIPPLTTPFWVVAVLGLSVAICVRLMASTHGRAWLAIREDEVASEALGVDSTRYKVIAFSLSSGLAGVAGALFAEQQQGFISPGSFDFMRSVSIVIMVVLGGMGSMSGAILAAVVLTLLPEVLRPLDSLTGVDLRMILYSLALILMMLWRPQGLLGRKEAWQLPWRAWFGKFLRRPAP